MAIADTISSMYENVGEVYDTITNVDVNTGKNLISSIDIFNGYPTGNNGGTIGYNTSVNSITYKKCAYVEANKTYTLSWKINVVKAVGSRDIKIVDDNDIILENFAYSNGNNNRTRTFTPTHNGWVYASLDTNATEVQLELGSSATEYQPYTDNPTYKNIENIPSTIRKSYLDIMNNGTDVVWNNWEKVTGEGETLTLNSTEEAPMKINLKGNTSQESTTGKNLFNVNTTHSNSLSDAGITATFNSDGTITVNGTKNANYKTISYFITLPAGTYYFSGCPSGGSSGGYSIIVQTTNEISSQIFDTGNGATFTLTEQKKISFFPVRVGADAVTFNNTVFKPMIARVPVTYNDYEPYTGGQPSPSPDYPQDIQVVSGDNSIDVVGKNLYYTDSQTKTFTSSAGSWKYLDGAAGADYSNPDNTLYKAYVENGKTYTFTCSITASASISSALMYYDNTTIQAASGTDLTYNKTFTARKTGYIIMRYYVNNGITVSISNVQLELGSTATTYEPHQSTTYPITLGNIELCKIGTYQDKIYKDNGKWYLNKQIGKVVLDGSEVWAKGNTRPFYTLAKSDVMELSSASSNATLICNYLQASKPDAIWSSNINGITNLDDGNAIRIRIKDDPYDITTFKQWLGTTKPIVYYVLATPTTTEITDSTLISQLDTIKRSYDEQTNITQVNNDLPFILDATALKQLT